MNEVECLTLSGEWRSFPREQLILRPAAYAVIVDAGKILLLTMRASGKYHLPGGGIHPGERIEETLRREAGEETGIEIEVGRLLHFEEAFFYYDPSDRAYHGLHFYYGCRAKTFDLLRDEQVKDGSAGQPRWVDIKSLRGEDFQLSGEKVLELCKQLTQLPIRYQAAIIDQDRVLLLRVNDFATRTTFWLFPGGGPMPGETPEACVKREVMEETSLQVEVLRFLCAIPDIADGLYDQLHTYLCRVIDGTAVPGIEPEVDAPGLATIQEVRWFDLMAPEAWPPLLRGDPITYPLLQHLRVALGYRT